ncbi:MAG: hypothetical protein M3N43_12410 [Actinomycetota bacterium]|nr:hypothetical protein [Actinomycetota bacterium]
MSEKWTVKGQIVVDHELPELAEAFGPRNGLAGIIVKVSARSKVLGGWGWWNGWGQQVTDRDGRFQVSESHGGDRRQFKVEILLDSDRMRMKRGQETSIRLDHDGFPLDIELDLTDKDWFEVHDDQNGAATDGRKAGSIDLRAIAVRASVARSLADAWFLYGKVLDLFESFGSGHAFQKKVTVKYPMNIGSGAAGSHSYSNPVNGCVYIKEGELYSRTLIHELMHQWAYQHSTGEDNMAWQLAKHGDTHQTRENTTFVPFHEAFAEWSSYKILKGITDGKLLNFKEDFVYKYPDLPLTRAHVSAALGASERTLANVDYTERGWHSLFNVLTIPYLDRCDFNRPLTDSDDEYVFYNIFTSDTCPENRLAYTLEDVLGVFLQYPAKGIDSYMRKDDLDFFHFLARAGAVLPGLEAEKIKLVKTCLNPNSTANPCPA